jgi:hypothetical protein
VHCVDELERRVMLSAALSAGVTTVQLTARAHSGPSPDALAGAARTQ